MPSIAVVGAGFGGVGAAVMLSRAGYRDVTVFERADRVGGVWNYNTYPGAACDVPSHLYEFSFAPNPQWSRRYAPQAEIQVYLEEVAQRHGVLDRIRLNAEVNRARWDGERGKWALQTSAGDHESDLLLTACGQLNVPKVPPISGLETFEGPSFHTARWRHDVDLSGKRVAVIGTGCSAIQVVPSIQPIVEHVDVYQRSPGWTFPRMDFAYSERAKRLF
jgi:cation diffusion facilitator CzcD-associated flavoprotein CzcO